ncbi:MAG TPA: hypothetical protein VMN36_17940 [Verrucomicrobiales bacterium]|nr:hypothetical protein [Verrucomicrobiales bacterium]
MAVVDLRAGEVLIKLVFEGAPAAGKATSLRAVRSLLPEGCCEELELHKASVDTVLRFDFVPPGTALIAGFRTRIRLVTVTGEVAYSATRRLCLFGADGVVFTVDSDPAREAENVRAYEGFADVVDQNRRNPDTIPLVFQYNKRDLPDAAGVSELGEAFAAGPADRYGVETVALEGSGLLRCLDVVMAEVVRRFEIGRQRFPELRGEG